MIGKTLKKAIKRFAADRSGATAIEYGLIAALIGAAIVSGLTSYTESSNKIWDSANSIHDDAQTAISK